MGGPVSRSLRDRNCDPLIWGVGGWPIRGPRSALAARRMPLLARLYAFRPIAVQLQLLVCSPHASRAMVSTVSRAMGRKVSDEVAELIVDFAGEVLPPGVSKRDWTRVLAGDHCSYVRVTHPSELRCLVEDYTRVLGKGRWRLGPRFLCREFPKVPDVLTQLLRREFMGFPDVLTRLAGSGLAVSLTPWVEWPGVEILEVDRSGGKYRMTLGRLGQWRRIADVEALRRLGQWRRIADVEGLGVQLRVFWEIGEWGE